MRTLIVIDGKLVLSRGKSLMKGGAMSNHKELVKDLISSFKNEPEKWEFDEHTARHIDSKVELWSSMWLIFLAVWRPTKVSFSLLEKIKIYQAMSECRAANISAAIKGAR
jgi:hypothetical protein